MNLGWKVLNGSLANLGVARAFLIREPPINVSQFFRVHRYCALQFVDFIGRHWQDSIVIDFFIDDNDAATIGYTTENTRPAATAADSVRFEAFEHMVNVISSQVMFFDVLHITARSIVPDDRVHFMRISDHAAASLAFIKILRLT